MINLGETYYGVYYIKGLLSIFINKIVLKLKNKSELPDYPQKMDEDPSFDEYENLTLDYANIPYLGEIKETPLVEIVLKSYLYIMVIFFSLIGNTLIIIVVLRHKQMRTTTNYYIVNLAVADILVTLFCTWVHLVNNLNNDNWVLGRFFCKFNTFSQGKSYVVT